MARRPYVLTRCVADRYSSTEERIVEFGTAGREGGSGLIAIRNRPDGTTVVEIYRADSNVTVLSESPVGKPFIVGA